MLPGKSESSLDAEALERILEVTRKLASPFDLTTMLTHVVDAGRAVLHADRGTVFLYEPRTHELVSSVATGSATLRFPADRGIVGECVQTRRLINVPDCYEDPRFNREVDRATGYRTRCLLTVPLIGYDQSLVGVLQVLNKIDGVFTGEDERIATALAAQCAVALQRMQMLAELVAKEKMERELAVAREIQMRFLPSEPPQVDGYEVTGWSRPADQTGGDVFDIIRQGEHGLILLLGDATGHGIGPALSVTQVRSMLRMAVRLGADLDAAFTHINDQLVEDLASNRFVTAFLGILDARAHHIAYHAAGQGPLLHFHARDGSCEWRRASTVPFGFIAGLPLKGAQVLEIEEGDIVALITDGVYEYESATEEAFGDQRTGEIVRRHARDPLPLLRDALVREVDLHGAGVPQADDMTLLLVRRVPRG